MDDNDNVNENNCQDIILNLFLDVNWIYIVLWKLLGQQKANC